MPERKISKRKRKNKGKKKKKSKKKKQKIISEEEQDRENIQLDSLFLTIAEELNTKDSIITNTSKTPPHVSLLQVHQNNINTVLQNLVGEIESDADAKVDVKSEDE